MLDLASGSAETAAQTHALCAGRTGGTDSEFGLIIRRSVVRIHSTILQGSLETRKAVYSYWPVVFTHLESLYTYPVLPSERRIR